MLYPITYFVKRDQNIWVFGSNLNKYIDNSKYLFEYVSKSNNAIEAIWITGDKKLVKKINSTGLKSYWRYSIKGMISAAKAGAFIYSYGLTDINMWLKRGAFKLNLWHGVGLKKVGIDIDRGPARKLFQPKGLMEKIFARINAPHLFDRDYHLLATSKITKRNYSKSFQIPEENIFISGYPRLQPFYSDAMPPKLWQSFDKVVLYMPTFRDDNPLFLNDAFPNAEMLNEVCKTENILIVFKLHQLTPQSETDRFKGFSNLELLDNHLDVYPLMKSTSAMITDYSSVFVDYAVLKKPILIYAHDYKSYVANSRDMYFNLDDLTKGKQLESFESLLEALSQLKNNSIPIDPLINIFWQEDSKHASKKITDWVIGQLNK